MQFMVVYTFTAENRDAVVKRRVEKGDLIPKGGKLISEWASTAGHRVFRIIEADDPKVLMGATFGWTDLGYVEMYPILPMDEVLQVIARK